MKKYVTKEEYKQVLAQVVESCFLKCSEVVASPFMLQFVDSEGYSMMSLTLKDARIVLSAIEGTYCQSIRKRLAIELNNFIRAEESAVVVL